jgi:hypothetical protein
VYFLIRAKSCGIPLFLAFFVVERLAWLHLIVRVTSLCRISFCAALGEMPDSPIQFTEWLRIVEIQVANLDSSDSPCCSPVTASVF